MNFSIIIGFERKGHKLRSEDYGQNFIRVEYYPYENLYNLKDILALQRATPIFYLKWYGSSDFGSNWSLKEQDIDCPFRQDHPIITGFSRRGQRYFTQDYGINWNEYSSPRDFVYFQYSWLLGIQRNTTINNTISSLDYGQTWINTADIKVASVESYINRIYVIITKSEVKVEKESELPLPEELFERMLSYLPKFERDSKVIKEILFSAAKELFNTQKNTEDLQNQFYVSTATWGLDIWEEMLGLQKIVLTDEERRQRIFNKLLSNTIATKYYVEKYLKNIIGKDIEVYEDFDNYSILIPSWEDGIPQNALSIVYLLREVIPAHLKIILEYRTWSWLDSKNWTWDYFEGLGLTWNELEEVDEIG